MINCRAPHSCQPYGARNDPGIGTDPLNFVVSMNLKRRHLNESQRAMIAGKIANMKLGDNQHTKEGGSIDLPSAAEMMNVSPASVKRAKSVQEHGTKELVKAVEDEGRRFGHHGQYARPDRIPGPDTLDIIQRWTWWDIKVEIRRLDEGRKYFFRFGGIDIDKR
jgi:hypothetical protein